MAILIFFLLSGFFFWGNFTYAHEAYVLPQDTFWQGLHSPFSFHAFDALKNSADLKTTIIIVISVIIFLFLNLLFRRSALGQRVHGFLDRQAYIGEHFVRFSIAGALFFSALSFSFLGPELHVGLFPYANIVRIALFAISAMIAAGFMTELAALAGITIFLGGFHIFGPYLLTYLNYLGEFIVLALFGLRVFSLDKYIWGPLKRFKFFEKYKVVIIRLLYGSALIYAAITVKLLHPDLTMNVVNTWHLTQFHWLFPSDPLLVTLGAGLVEAAIGLFIIFGFEMRVTVLVSMFYITLSLLYFRELVWPHLLLYGLSLNLLVEPEVLTLDDLLFNRSRKKETEKL